MRQDISGMPPNLVMAILKPVIVVVTLVFAVYVGIITISVYNMIISTLATSHESALSRIEAELISDLNRTFQDSQNIANSRALRSEAMLPQVNSTIINDLFADAIRLKPSSYHALQYINRNGIIYNEVVNERGIPKISGASYVPRTNKNITQSQAFQLALQALSVDDYYIGDFSLLMDAYGIPVQPLQPYFSVYVPIFDMDNSRIPLGVLRFVVVADGILNTVNSPIVSESEAPAGRDFVLLDNNNHVIAHSNASPQDYLYDLVGVHEDGVFYEPITDLMDQLEAYDVSLVARDQILYTARGFMISDSANMTWRLVIADSQNIVARTGIIVFFIILFTLMFIGVVFYILKRLIEPTLSPITALSYKAQQLASYSFVEAHTSMSQVIQVDDYAVVKPIATALVFLLNRIEMLNSQLIKQSEQYAHNLQVITKFGHDIASDTSAESLIETCIELVCTELEAYYAQVFLIDDAVGSVVLVKGRGNLLQHQHIWVDAMSDNAIGRVIKTASPEVIHDTRSIRGSRCVWLLPDSRSEMLLPLLIDGRCIGLLDIQSTEMRSFRKQDIPYLQIIVNQLAIVIDHVRQLEQSDQRYEQFSMDNRHLIREAWHNVQEEYGLSGEYSYSSMGFQVLTEETDVLDGQLSAPISVRDEVIGTLSVRPSLGHEFSEGENKILQQVAERVAITVDNARLFQQTQAALQETKKIYEATTMITQSQSMDDIVLAIRKSIDVLQPQMSAAYVMSSPYPTQILFNSGFDDALDCGVDLDVLFTVALPESVEIYSYDQTHASAGDIDRELHKAGHIKSFFVVNLWMKESNRGRILIGFNDHLRFTERVRDYLHAISNSVSVVIDKQLLLSQLQASLDRTSALYQSGRALTEATSPQQILDAVVQYLIEQEIELAFIALLETPTWHDINAMATIEASWHFEASRMTLNATHSPMWSLLSSSQVLIINDTAEQHEPIANLGIRSLVVIPLKVPNRVIGSILIGSPEPYHYTQDRMGLYESFAESASLSLEASYLFKQAKRRAHQLETSAEVAQQIGQLLNLDNLLRSVVELIKESFDYDHVQIFLMDISHVFAELKASTDTVGQKLLAQNYKLARASHSVIGQVVEYGSMVIVQDTSDENAIYEINPLLPDTRAEIAFPLMVQDQVVGALDVQSNHVYAFTDEDIRALTTLSGQIAIAIENANLYNQIERRASDMELLFNTTVTATESTTLEESLQAVTEKLCDAFAAYCVVFYLPIQHMQLTILSPITKSGHIASLGDIHDVVVGDEDNLIGIVGDTLEARLVTDIRREPCYQPIASCDGSAMVVPISAGEKLIGLMVIEHEQLNALSQNDLQVVVTLAGSLSAVVQNSMLLDDLKRSNDQLREVDQLKSQFLASMSHELRTPLNSIIGFSRVMLKGIDGELTDMQSEDLMTIYNSGQHLLTLINDILDQAKIESGKMELLLEFFDVSVVLKSVKAIGIGLVKEKPIDIRVEIEPNLEPAYGDESRTRQILLNLLSNAVKFTSEGHITISAHRIVDEAGQGLIQIDVTDTGIGIENDHLPILFERFRQIESSLNRTSGGTGLGLPLSKAFAKLQGGNLTVTSSVVEKGSTFSLTIPMCSREEAIEPEQQTW